MLLKNAYMDKIEDFRDKLKKNKENIKKQCPLKRGDIIEFEYKNKIEKGIFDYFYISNNFNTAIKINLPKISSIGYTSSYVYIRNPDCSKIKKISNTLNSEKLERINDLIDLKHYEIEKATRVLQHQLEKLERLKYEEHEKCIHDFEQGDFIRIEKGDMWTTEKEMYEYTCKHCGLVVIN